MGRYSYSQPSSSQASDGRDSVKVMDRSGVPVVCNCGLVPVTHTSTTVQNPGRVFFGCRNHKDGGHHVFKWLDEALVEEITNLRLAVQNQARNSRFLGLEGGGGEEVRFIRDTLTQMKTDIVELKDAIVKKRLEGGCKSYATAFVDSNIVVLAGVIISLITYIICKK